MDRNKVVCGQNTVKIAETLESLGFILNREKSTLEPTQKITYFGYVLDSVLDKVFLPDKQGSGKLFAFFRDSCHKDIGFFYW